MDNFTAVSAPDFLLTGDGPEFLLGPLSPAALEFNDLNSPYGLPRIAPIEARWLPEVREVIMDSGFTVARKSA
jgi:hypothetical protein